jgi:hypothetical protein
VNYPLLLPNVTEVTRLSFRVWNSRMNGSTLFLFCNENSLGKKKK